MRDKQSITVACIYRFLKKGKINRKAAVQLMISRAGVHHPENTVSIWCRHLKKETVQ
jgi:hypothetical protein